MQMMQLCQESGCACRARRAAQRGSSCAATTRARSAGWGLMFAPPCHSVYGETHRVVVGMHWRIAHAIGDAQAASRHSPRCVGAWALAVAVTLLCVAKIQWPSNNACLLPLAMC